jgi:hypothetical protein
MAAHWTRFLDRPAGGRLAMTGRSKQALTGGAGTIRITVGMSIGRHARSNKSQAKPGRRRRQTTPENHNQTLGWFA